MPDDIRCPWLFGKHVMPYGAAALLFILMVMGCQSEAPTIDKAAPEKETPSDIEGTIVAVGDSLTAGLGVEQDQAYPAKLARKLRAAGYRYQVINAGVSGETSSGARSRIEWVLTSLNPDIVILETGANDGLRGIDPKVLATNLEQICTILKDNGVQVLLAGMQMLPNLGPEYVESFATIYPRMAHEHQLVFMPFLLEGVAGDPELNQGDRIHPTAEGYRRIVDNLYPYVVQTIKQHRAAAKTK